MSLDAEKQSAATSAIRFVKNGNIVGLGSGSTAAHALRCLAEQIRQGLKIKGIPTSTGTHDLAVSLGIPLTTLDEYQEIDVTIDGADEIDPQLQIIKGGGAAFLREKIIASASRQLVIIADSTKLVPILGQAPLPIEVIPFAQALVAKEIASLGATTTLRPDAAGKPLITDEGHHILDCHFGKIPDPPALARTLEKIPGIVEHGLFINMASIILIGKNSSVEELHARKTT